MACSRPVPRLDALDCLVGAAPAIQTIRVQIRHLARFDAVSHPAVPTVLLRGETGTGKGLVARLIHDSGPRAQGPFIQGPAPARHECSGPPSSRTSRRRGMGVWTYRARMNA